MLQPRGPNVGAAVIADRAEHAWLQLVVGHSIWKTADVQFGVVMTAGITAADEHTVSAVSSHVRQRHGLSWSKRFGIVQGMPHRSAVERTNKSRSSTVPPLNLGVACADARICSEIAVTESAEKKANSD